MNQDKTNKKYITRIVEQVLDQIAELYLYFLAIYLVCLVFSLFFERWKLFFDWEIFHFSVVLFGVLSLLSKKGKEFVSSQKKLLKLFKFKRLPRLGFRKEVLKNLIATTVFKVKKLTKKDYLKIYLKIIIMAIVLGFSLYKGIEPINFLVLAYALISILWIIESRIAAIIALLFLASCPVLMILKKEPLAETMAIYAFYFLVICVVTQVREYLKDKKNLSTG